MTNKKASGKDIPEWYKMGDFEKIEEYIEQETKSFIECLQSIQSKLKELF